LGFSQPIIDMPLSIVKLCVLNQNQNYLWLLSNALSFTLTLYIVMKVDVAKVQDLNQSLIHGDFYSKLLEFKLRIMAQVIKVQIFILDIYFNL
jgi:hypothetical protein